jgi:hypothetical protein
MDNYSIIHILLQIGAFVCCWKITSILYNGFKIKYGKKVANQIEFLAVLLVLILLFVKGATSLGWLLMGMFSTLYILTFITRKLTKVIEINTWIELHARGQIILEDYEKTGWGNSLKADKVRESMAIIYKYIPENKRDVLEKRTTRFRKEWAKIKEQNPEAKLTE